MENGRTFEEFRKRLKIYVVFLSVFQVRWGKLEGCGPGIILYCWYVAVFCVLCLSSKNSFEVLRGKLWAIEGNVVRRGLELEKLDPLLSRDRPSEGAMEGWAIPCTKGRVCRIWAISKGSSSHCGHVSLISYSIYFWKTQKVQNAGQLALGFINLVTRLTRWSDRLLELAITTWNNRSVNKGGAKAMPYPLLSFGETGNSIHLQVSHPKWTMNASPQYKAGKLFWTGASLPSNMHGIQKFCAIPFSLKVTYYT